MNDLIERSRAMNDYKKGWRDGFRAGKLIAVCAVVIISLTALLALHIYFPTGTTP